MDTGKGGPLPYIAEHDRGSFMSPETKLAIWFSFQILGGQIMMPILVATFVFSKTAKRDPTLVNLCGTFILTGFCGCLLLYAGQAYGPEPSKGLCILQASLVTACPPTWSVAMLALVYQTWHSLDTKLKTRPISRRWKIFMVLAPYIAFLGWATITAILSGMHPAKVSRKRRLLYCSLDYEHYTNSVSIATTVACAVIIAFAVRLGVRLFRAWRFAHRAGQVPDVNFRLALRLVVFMLYIFGGTVFSVWSIFDRQMDTTGRDLFIATMGVAVFVVFGTQRDVVQAWFFWRRPRSTDSRLEDEKTLTAHDIDAKFGEHDLAVSRSSTPVMVIANPARGANEGV